MTLAPNVQAKLADAMHRDLRVRAMVQHHFRDVAPLPAQSFAISDGRGAEHQGKLADRASSLKAQAFRKNATRLCHQESSILRGLAVEEPSTGDTRRMIIKLELAPAACQRIASPTPLRVSESLSPSGAVVRRLSPVWRRVSNEQSQPFSERRHKSLPWKTGATCPTELAHGRRRHSDAV
eukprot:m.167382 g.167382  ORF g.167382 m.167382 type:complete len:180 (+) comp53167_c0_seq2:229-768(+)